LQLEHLIANFGPYFKINGRLLALLLHFALFSLIYKFVETSAPIPNSTNIGNN
jgi:hypothetical protein